MRRKLFAFVASAAVAFGSSLPAAADVFYPFADEGGVVVTYPDDVGGAFWPESNLIQGPGVGFDAAEPHDKIGGADAANWVTTADCGFPSDYVDCVGEPVIELDLGQDRLLSEISTWGYEDGNSNGMREFQLRFATDSEGPVGYGTSVSYNPTFFVDDFFEFTAAERRSFEFDQNVTARYVELTVTDNYFEEPGDGTGENAWPAGGDRVGIGEIAFRADDGFEPPPVDPPVAFYLIADIEASTADTDFWPAENLIQGPGEGFSENQPHNLQATGENGLWVTDACGFPCDYLEDFDPPELVIDLGEDVELDEINIWGYSATNANGVREFELEFATDADGDDGFGTSVSYNPTFDDVDINPTDRQIFPFEQTVSARYVKVTPTDNYFEDPGDGTGENGFPAGGDRIGIGEIAFPIPTGGILGDFDGDGTLDVDDINLLVGESAAASTAAEFDLNNDGVVNRVDISTWANDLAQSWIGDSNLDGEFNSGDLVSVFSQGKFESGEAANWAEGDWTGDGAFDSSDFVFAFQGGGYEQGPRPAVVPEPTAGMLSLLGLCGVMTIRRRR